MMRVTDTFRIKGRGLVACVESDGPCPLNGSQLSRVSDGQTWTVKGVERFALYLGTHGRAGEKIGILLGDGPDPVVGDELMRVEDRPLRPPNLYKPPRQISHASLVKISAESDFKVKCPVCSMGMLLVGRNQVTMLLLRDDYCISCGQRFIYTDYAIGGEPLEQDG